MLQKYEAAKSKYDAAAAGYESRRSKTENVSSRRIYIHSARGLQPFSTQLPVSEFRSFLMLLLAIVCHISIASAGACCYLIILVVILERAYFHGEL